MGIVLVVLLSCFAAAAETTNSIRIGNSNSTKTIVKTEFVDDGQLTRDEISQVMELARRTGVTNVAQVTTFYFLPTNCKGIAVKSTDLRDGRNTRFDTVYINKTGWAPVPSHPKTKLKGKFWIDDLGKVSTLLRDYKSTNGQIFKVSVAKGVDFALADAIIDQFITNKLLPPKIKATDESVLISTHPLMPENAKPKLIRKADSENAYELEFDNYPTTVLKFKFEKGKVVIIGLSEYVI